MSVPGSRRLRSWCATLFTVVMCSGVPLAHAQSPLTFIVATSPGTGVDILAREIGQQITQNRRVPVVVDNKPGASGNLGAEFVARSRPDGGTFLVAATTFATNAALNKATLPFDPARDFVPVALLGTGTLALVVSPSTPANTVQEFIAAAKAAPGKMAYASPGNGTPQHLAMELIKIEAGIDLLHVPFKATSGAVNDVAGGHVAAMIVPVHTALPLITGGKLKALALLSRERVAALPKVPTFREAGLPNVQVDVWYGLFAPAGTPAAAVTKLNQDVNAALKGKGVAESLARQGIEAAGGPPQAMASRLQAELQRWPPVVQAAHITAD